MEKMSEGSKAIVIDLRNSILHITLEDEGIQFSVHFDNKARSFYLAIIALVVNEMTRKKKIQPIKMKPSYELLVSLNRVLTENRASEDQGKLLGRVYRKWKNVLPDLEKGNLFSVVERDRIECEETKSKLYEVTGKENEIWRKLFSYDGKETEARLCFSIDKIGLGLDNISIIYDTEDQAWQRFVNDINTSEAEELYYQALKLYSQADKRYKEAVRAFEKKNNGLGVAIATINAFKRLESDNSED